MTFESINVADNLICPVLEDNSGPAIENVVCDLTSFFSFRFLDCKILRAYEKSCQIAADNLICPVFEDDSGREIKNDFFHDVI